MSVAEGGKVANSLPPSNFSYGKIFEERCPEYMAMGMSYSEYWDGAAEIAKMYRKAFMLKRDNQNFYLWLQGLYVYEALIGVAPIINPLSKKSEPIPYRDSPISLTKAQEAMAQEEANKKKMAKGKTAMMNMAMAINKNLSTKKEEDNNV